MSYALRKGTRANDTLVADNVRSRLSTSTNAVIGDLEVNNNAIIHENLRVDGNSSVGGRLDVSGSARVDGSIDVGGAIDVCGSGSFGGSLDVCGSGSFGGTVDIAGELNVSGDATFDASMNILGDVVIHGDLTVVKESTLSETTYVHNDIFYTVAQTVEQPATFYDTVTICGTLDVSGDASFNTIICNDQIRYPNNKIRITKDYTTFVNQGTDTIAIGENAGRTNQGNESIAIGHSAGLTDQSNYSVAIGHQAGQTSQGTESVAIGYQAGQTSQGKESVAIGYYSGVTNQGDYAVAIGRTSAQGNQGEGAVSVGNAAGDISQGTLSVAVGYFAGYDTQGTESVAVGHQAGRDSQGKYAVAVGFKAGLSGQADNSIVLNAQSTQLDTTTSGFFVKPVREQENTVGWTPPGTVWYDSSTGELASQPDISQGTIAVDLTLSGDLNVRGDIDGDPGSVLTLRNTFPVNQYGYIHLLTAGAKDIYFGVSDPATDPQGYNINANIGGGNDFGLDFFGKTGVSAEERICRFAVSTTVSGYQPEAGHGGLTVEDTIKSDRILVDTELGINITPSGGNVLDVSGNGRVRGDFRVDGSFNIGPASVTMWEDACGNLTMAHSTASTNGININLHDLSNTVIDSGDSSRGILIGPKDVPGSTIHISKDGKIGIGKRIEGDISQYKTLDVAGDVEIDGGLFIHGSEIGVSGIDTGSVTTRQLQLYNLSEEDAIVLKLSTFESTYNGTTATLDKLDADLTHGTISGGQWIGLSDSDEHTIVNHSTVNPTIHARLPPNHGWYGTKLHHVNYDLMCDTSAVDTSNNGSYGIAGRDFTIASSIEASYTYASFDVVLPAWFDSSENYTFPEGTKLVVYGKGLPRGPNGQRTFLRLIVPGYDANREEANIHMNFAQISPDISYGLARYLDQPDPGEGASALSRIPDSNSVWFDLTSVPPMRNLEVNAWMRDSNDDFDNQYPNYAPGTVSGFTEDNTKCIWRCECVSTTHGWVIDRFTITNGDGNTTVPQNLVVKKDANVDGTFSTNTANILNDLGVSGDAFIQTGGSVFVGGKTISGDFGVRLHHSTEGSSYLDSVGPSSGFGFHIRSNDINGSTSRMYVDGLTGNVGIGTVVPSHTLDVSGTVNTTGEVTIQSTTNSTTSSTGALIVNGGIGVAEDIVSDGNIKTYSPQTAIERGLNVFNTGGGTVGKIVNDDSFHIYGVYTNVYINDVGKSTVNTIMNRNNGNVGIGMINPAEKLDVTGNIRATGSITGGAITGSSLSTGTGSITGGAITGSSLSTGTGSITGNSITGSSLTATGADGATVHYKLYIRNDYGETNDSGGATTSTTATQLALGRGYKNSRNFFYIEALNGSTNITTARIAADKAYFATIQHPVRINNNITNDYYGLLFKSTGMYMNTPTLTEAHMYVELCDTVKDKRIYGVLSPYDFVINSTDDNNVQMYSLYHPQHTEDTKISYVSSGGEGMLWVCDIGGPIENGDYICSSSIPGMGMLQDDDLKHNYTCFKASIDCNFTTPGEYTYPKYDMSGTERIWNDTSDGFKYSYETNDTFEVHDGLIMEDRYIVKKGDTVIINIVWDFATNRPELVGMTFKAALIGGQYICE